MPEEQSLEVEDILNRLFRITQQHIPKNMDGEMQGSQSSSLGIRSEGRGDTQDQERLPNTRSVLELKD
jgi:hypothetical protein